MELIKDHHNEDLAFRTRRFTRRLVRGLLIISLACAAYFASMAFMELVDGTARSFMWFGIGGAVSLGSALGLSMLRI